jgi:hypothetical protein
MKLLEPSPERILSRHPDLKVRRLPLGEVEARSDFFGPMLQRPSHLPP